MSLHRRSFLVGLGTLLAAPTVVRADHLMKVTGERFAASCFGESDMMLRVLNELGQWRGVPILQHDSLIAGMSKAILGLPVRPLKPTRPLHVNVRRLEFVASHRAAAALDIEYREMSLFKWGGPNDLLRDVGGSLCETKFRGIPVKLDETAHA